MEKFTARCMACGGKLFIKKTCQQVNLCCRSCNSQYPLEKFADLMDDFFEQQLANIRCDRL